MGLIVLLLLVVAGIVFYTLSVQSRKTYRCPQCGEEIADLEHMEATHCMVCGAPIERKKERE